MNNSYTETTHVRVDYQKLHLVACTAAESRYESTESEKSTVKGYSEDAELVRVKGFMLGSSARNLQLGRSIRSARVGQQARQVLSKVQKVSLSTPSVLTAGTASSSGKRPAEREQRPAGGKRSS